MDLIDNYIINSCKYMDHVLLASQVVLGVKDPPANAGDIRDMGSIPEFGRSVGGEHGNPLLYS